MSKRTILIALALGFGFAVYASATATVCPVGNAFCVGPQGSETYVDSSGNLKVNGNATATGNLTISGTAAITGAVTNSGAVTQKGNLTMSAAAYVVLSSTGNASVVPPPAAGALVLDTASVGGAVVCIATGTGKGAWVQLSSGPASGVLPCP